ncbi:MAG: CaiB/BaiF CoA transferase family protein [Dehalococcoidia bacterium]
MTGVLAGVRMLEIGGRAAWICGHLLAQMGAEVVRVPWPPATEVDPENWILSSNTKVLDINPATAESRRLLAELLERVDAVVIDVAATDLGALELEPKVLRAKHRRLVVATISPFGTSGPRREFKGNDLVTFHSSGIARLLVGHVEDVESEPPVRAAGDQADFISGLTTACAMMHALYQQRRTGQGQMIDVSAQEALSLMAARELAIPGFGGQPAARGGREPGGSAVIPVLPTCDGFVAISPREPHQWERWLDVLGQPEWSADPKFATRAGRTANYAELFAHMAGWSRTRSKTDIFRRCQEAHVPCFPFGSVEAMLEEPQLASRGFFADGTAGDGSTFRMPRPPFGLADADYATAGEVASPAGWDPRPEGVAEKPALPLDGIRVLDFSWVIAGPTCTRYLALMGADVIKVEGPGKPDAGRASELHDVLGESKLGLCLDLRADGALEAIRSMLRTTDVVVENFATGVMERFGLGYDDLRAINPNIILLSASGLGRKGPGSQWVAYGNLLSAYSGFAEGNAPGGGEPRTGLAWADPLCGLFMAFGIVAALHARERSGRHIDFSMLEGLLWTMPGALLAAQGKAPSREALGNRHPVHVPYNVFRASGDDAWLAVGVTSDDQWKRLCGVVSALGEFRGLSEPERMGNRVPIEAQLAEWVRDREPIAAMELLQAAGVPASASYSSNQMFGDAHLWERGFYQTVIEGDGTPRVLPGLPWRWGDDQLIQPRPAPKLGEHSEQVLREFAGLSEQQLTAVRAAGALR